jgi:serine protease AprX
MQAIRARGLALLSGLLVIASVLTGTVAGVSAASSASSGASVDPGLRGLSGAVKVVVQTTGGAVASVEQRVADLGGTVTKQLSIIDGFAATVPGGKIAELAATQGIRAISRDLPVHVQGSINDPSTWPSVYSKVVRADDLAASGASGQGVTVALVDTGVDSGLPDLAGQVVPVTTDPLGLTKASCVNLSSDPGCQDSYGHGTFIAGLIAGNGAASNGQYVGTAPRAKIVSVKIAGPDGSSDVSNLLAAIEWVVSFKDTYGIRVLNLSLGTDSTQSYKVDPLDYAVEKAWQSGVVVVVAASNRGPAPQTISKPADDPFVLTVGAIDDQGTAGLGDDVLPNFSGRGPTAADGIAKPDVVAPGAHVVSLAARNAMITNQFPSSMAAPYRRGSGTSMATGIVSGVVADMLSADPSMTPDRVKYALMSTARSDASSDSMAVGAGVVDGYSAAYSAPAGLANQGVPSGNGTGSLDLSRGSVYVSAAGSSGSVVVNGNLTAQLTLWNPLNSLLLGWTGNSWYSSQWYGNSWYGNSWYGNSWYGNSWYGNSWYGQPSGYSWYGNSWYGSSWYGAWDQ